MEWNADTRIDTAVPRNPKPTSQDEQHLVNFVILTYLVC